MFDRKPDCSLVVVPSKKSRLPSYVGIVAPGLEAELIHRSYSFCFAAMSAKLLSLLPFSFVSSLFAGSYDCSSSRIAVLVRRIASDLGTRSQDLDVRFCICPLHFLASSKM